MSERAGRGIEWVTLAMSACLTVGLAMDGNWYAAGGWAVAACMGIRALRAGTEPHRDTLHRAGTELLRKATSEFDIGGPHDARGAAIWDCGSWLREKAADELSTAAIWEDQ